MKMSFLKNFANNKYCKASSEGTEELKTNKGKGFSERGRPI